MTEESIHESIKRVKAHLEKDEFNEGLSILNELPDSPEKGDLQHQFDQAKSNKIEALLELYEEAIEDEDWDQASDLIQEAQNLDSQDKRIQSAVQSVTELSDTAYLDDEITEKRDRAQSLLDKTEKRIEDLDVAIRLLLEILSSKENIDVRALLDKAQAMRSEFLKREGQVATLEQAGEFEEALKNVNDMIQRGKRDFQGKDIFEYRGVLENKVKDFAEEKAGNYMLLAEGVLEDNPQVALQYINLGLDLPFVPSKRKSDLDDLKIKVHSVLEKHNKAEKTIKEAQSLINKNGDYEQAVRIFESVVNELPNFSKAKRHLDTARDGLNKKISQDTKNRFARVRTWITQGHLEKARQEILNIIDKLGMIEEEESLRRECENLLEEVNKKERIENNVKSTIELVSRDLDEGDLTSADTEINALDKETQDHPKIRKLSIQLANEQEIENAIMNARKAFEDDLLQSAHDQISVLKSRAANNEDVIQLYNEIEPAFQYLKAEEYFHEGNLEEAKKAYRKVIKFDSPLQTKADARLVKINEFNIMNQQAEGDYKKAKKLHENGKFEDAYKILVESEYHSTSYKDKILTLRNVVREEWRDELKNQIKVNIRTNVYDQVLELANRLEAIKEIGDTKLLNDTKKRYYIHKAQTATSHELWEKAYDFWTKAKHYDSDDKRIINGLKKTGIKKAVQIADFSNDNHEVIRILDSVFDSQEMNLEIDERLWKAYILTDEYNKASHLLMSRIRIDHKKVKNAEIKKDLCNRLIDSKEKFDRKAYKKSIDILKRAFNDFPDFSDIIQDKIRDLKQEIIDRLMHEANELKKRDEKFVHYLPKYREILSIDSDHIEAKQRNKTLSDEFKRYVVELTHECIGMEKDDNTSLEEIEEKIKEIINAMALATSAQKTKIKPHLDQLSAQRRTLQMLEKRITRIYSLLELAKEDGDFSVVDRELTDISSKISNKNNDFTKLTKEIREIKEERKNVCAIVDIIRNAFETSDFKTIELEYDPLLRLDPDDKFSLQKNRLHLKDFFENREIEFKDLKIWAKQRRQNLEHLNIWFQKNRIDLKSLEKEEQKLREKAKEDYEYRKDLFINALMKLSNDYNEGAQKLSNIPKSPMSSEAQTVYETIEEERRLLSQKASAITDEALKIESDEEKVQKYIERISGLIEERAFSQAKIELDEVIKLSPIHPMIPYYKGLIQNEL